MSHARAAIAGMLSTGLVLLLVFPSDQMREPERALAALFGLLAIVALLVDVDLMAAWRRRRHVEPPQEAPPDG